ncbi:MAG: hypothetical protein ACTMUB_06575 [cyanobacterium endosymbiont of Rhopalodia musculus]
MKSEARHPGSYWMLADTYFLNNLVQLQYQYKHSR